MDLSQRMEFCQQLLDFLENFVFVLNLAKGVDLMYQSSKRPYSYFSKAYGVLFEGAFSL